MGVNVANGMPARYLATPPTLVNGQPSALMVDVNGRLLIAGTISAGTIAIEEFPAAAAITDNFANPTTTQVAAMSMIYDGATWDRWTGAVSVSQATPGVTNRVALAVSTGAGTEALLRDSTQFGDGVSDGIAAVHQRYFNGSTYDRWKGYFPFINGRVTADGQIKGSAGFVHCINVSPTAATSTAGVITIYDSLTETGTVLATIYCPTNDTTVKTIPIDVVAGTGIYVGYDAAVTNHAVNISYI